MWKDVNIVKIDLIAVGKIKTKYLKLGIDEFIKRLSRYAKVSIIDLGDEKIPINPNNTELENLRNREAERIAKRVKPNSYVIVLDQRGKALSSEGLAALMENLMIQGKSHLTFVIGGALGLDRKIFDSADFVLSCSKMTFTHQMIRLMLLEQIYRGFKIIHGEPYHK